MNSIDSSDTFYKMHGGVIWLNHISGIVTPLLPFKSKTYHTVVEVYVFAMNALAVISTVTITGGILFVPDLEFIKISSACTCLSTLVYVTTIGLLTLGKRQEFSDLSEHAGRIIDICSNDPLDDKRTFIDKFKRNVKYITVYTTSVLFITSFMASMYVLPGYIKNFTSLGFKGNSDLEFPLWFPVDYKESPWLDIAFVIELAGILVSATRTNCSEGLLLAYLHCQIQALRHLKYTMKRVFDDRNPDNDSDKEVTLTPLDSTVGAGKSGEDVDHLSSQEEKLKHWINMHQEILKLGKMMMNTYNGIITTYMASIMIIVTFGMFTALQKTPGPEERIQIAGVLFYTTTTMCSYYLLCHFGSLASLESQTVAQLGYFSNWFDSDKKIKTNMKIIFERTQNPLLITAYGSPMFDVSKETYLAFVKSIVSFYLTLSQFSNKFNK